MGPTTCYTLRRYTASAMKVLFCISYVELRQRKQINLLTYFVYLFFLTLSVFVLASRAFFIALFVEVILNNIFQEYHKDGVALTSAGLQHIQQLMQSAMGLNKKKPHTQKR